MANIVFTLAAFTFFTVGSAAFIIVFIAWLVCTVGLFGLRCFFLLGALLFKLHMLFDQHVELFYLVACFVTYIGKY